MAEVPDFSKVPKDERIVLQVRMTKALRRRIEHARIETSLTTEQWVSVVLDEYLRGVEKASRRSRVLA